MYIYKVVRNWKERSKTGRSAMIRRGPYRLKYTIGERTQCVPGSVGILAFETQRAAESFMRIAVFLPGRAVLECSTRCSKRRVPPDALLTVGTVSRTRKIFSKNELRAFKSRMYGLPGRTVAVNSLTPIRRVV